jgi:Glycosyl transferase family 2/Glycosyl transferases group 1
MSSSLPRTLEGFRGFHDGATIVVCGCGRSLAEFTDHEQFITIGVNDVGRLFQPTYLVVLNPRSQFSGDRFNYVAHSRAQALFTQLNLGINHPHIVRFTLGQKDGVAFDKPDVLPYTRNSPYVAVCLAALMGAKRIGLIGVDFTDDHFFGRTGRHPLTGQLAAIDQQYQRLEQALRARGVEVVNLSRESRLTAFGKGNMEEFRSPEAAKITGREPRVEVRTDRRVFCVHYRFLSCGTVFETGLREATQTLGTASEHAYWDDPQLLEKVRRFDPDLLFVVHGRRFVQRWGDRFKSWRSAVWLLDEPYEVDDTAKWSGRFDYVFVNDPATLERHRNAHLLPVAYAPSLQHHRSRGEARYRVGFIGGGNPSRERLLAGLAQRGLLDYVVGGPWREPKLRALCLSDNIPAEQTAALYRDTAIVINVFRDRHHYNRAGVAATAMNPRICEALACGALVLSEPREGLLREIPELPIFRDEAEAAALVERFLADAAAREAVRRACFARLEHATYSARLRVVMEIALERQTSSVQLRPQPVTSARTIPFDADWDVIDGVARAESEGEIVLDPGASRGPGAERGLMSRARYTAVDLTFEARLEPDACLVAKVHQVDAIDQTTNSYHVLVDERRAYLARHHHIFCNFDPPHQVWVKLRLAWRDGVLSLWRDDRLLHRVRDAVLASGFAVISAQGGRVRLRAVRLATVGQRCADEADELKAAAAPAPRLSIVTTVYDRIECLRHCIASVQRLTFQNYEHLIVADHPPAEVIEQIHAVVSAANDARIGLFNLKRRHNNWGIAPAAAGLRRARGQYLSFLSDDNGYTEEHADQLIRALEREPGLGFVYSSCQYDGRMVLSHPVPGPGRIDLGQLMFRREMFALHLDEDLPFDMMAWDWHMVDALMRRGVRWRHVNQPSFLFRLAKYPHLIPT